MIEDILGSSFGLFLFSTVVVFGWAAWQTGQALAQTWRSIWYLIPYGLMLAAADRLLVVLLFEGRLLAPVPFIVTTAVLLGLAALAYRLTLVRKMIGQYPWVYERDGLFGWRERTVKGN
jgi:hypothetical protein